MLGCLWGMDAALTCVTSSQSNQILAGLSLLMDNALLREKEAEERSRAHLASLNETTRVFNEHMGVYTGLVTKAETLLLTLQDVQNKIASVPPATPRSLSSHQQRAEIDPVEYITEFGVYTCDHGTVTLKEQGHSFEGNGLGANVISDIISCSKKFKIVTSILNLRLEDVIGFAENEPVIYKQLIGGSAGQKLNAYQHLMQSSRPRSYQWSKIKG